MGGICITNKSLYPLPAVSGLFEFVIITLQKLKRENKASHLRLPSPFKCHRVSTWDDTTIINKRSLSVSQRYCNRPGTFFSGAIKMQMAVNVLLVV